MRGCLLLCMLALTDRAAAAFDVFLQVTPSSGTVAGGAADPLYSGWIKVHSLESTAEKDVQVTSGTPPPVARLLPVTIVKPVDSSTPLLFSMLASGTHALQLKMVVVARDPSRVELWELTYETVYFTGQGFEYPDQEIRERLTFVAGKAERVFTELSPTGDPLADIFGSFNQGPGVTQTGRRQPSYPGGADTDNDGIPDGWETFYTLNHRVADSGQDTDHDGMSNLNEFLARTNPINPNSVFRLTAVSKPAADKISLTWLSVPGVRYKVESAAVPTGPFTLIRNVSAASAAASTTTIVDAIPSRLFFRVTPLPP